VGIVNSCSRLVLAGVIAWLAAGAAPASAHTVPPEVVTFVKVEGSQARVLVRVPTIMLTDAHLPMVDIVYLNLRALDARLRVIASEVARNLDVTDRGRALPPPSASWIVSLLTDTSFETWERAEARLTQAPFPLDKLIYWNEAFADFQFDYPLADGEHRLSARVNGLRMGGDFFQTRVTYVPVSGAPRTMTVAGPPQRLEFEPSAADAVVNMVRRAAAQMGVERLLLLFVFCLAIPQRRLDVPVRALTAFFASQIGGVLLMALLPGAAADPAVQSLAQIATGSLLVIAAIQNVASAGGSATIVVSLLFGACHAVGLGAAARAALPVAGSHSILALAAFLGVIEGGALWLLLIARPLLRTAFQFGFPAWLPLAVLSAIPAHEGSHAVLDAASRLGALGEFGFSQPLVSVVVNHWPVLALGTALVVLLITAAAIRRGASNWLPPDPHPVR
jgi:hypothetical protein